MDQSSKEIEKRRPRRVEIEPIENRKELHVTFTKRRQGLFKKTGEFCGKFGATAAVITFSKAGSLFAYGNPQMEPILRQYLQDPSSSVAAASNNGELAVSNGAAVIEEALGKGRPAWDAALKDLGMGELEDIEIALTSMRREVAERAKAMSSSNS